MNNRSLNSAAILAIVAASTLPVPALADEAHHEHTTHTAIPTVAVNALLLGRVAEVTDAVDYNTIDLQETEIRFTSYVDDYWCTDLVLAFRPGHEDHGYESDLEVARVVALDVPGGFDLVAGKDYVPFGRHVPLHAHQFTFVEAPVAVSTLIGGHALAETGLQASHRLPLPWHSHAVAYAVGGSSVMFDAESRDLAFGARWEHDWSRHDGTGLSLGGSWLRGRMSPGYLAEEETAVLAGDVAVYGADLSWRAMGRGHHESPRLELIGEVILPRPEAGADRPFGWYAHSRYRVTPDWILGLAVGGVDRDPSDHDDHTEVVDDGHAHEAAQPYAWDRVLEMKANLTWSPSEFSSLRFEAARYEDQDEDRHETVFSVQLNFTVGSHEGHRH